MAGVSSLRKRSICGLGAPSSKMDGTSLLTVLATVAPAVVVVVILARAWLFIRARQRDAELLATAEEMQRRADTVAARAKAMALERKARLRQARHEQEQYARAAAGQVKPSSRVGKVPAPGAVLAVAACAPVEAATSPDAPSTLASGGPLAAVGSDRDDASAADSYPLSRLYGEHAPVAPAVAPASPAGVESAAWVVHLEAISSQLPTAEDMQRVARACAASSRSDIGLSQPPRPALPASVSRSAAGIVFGLLPGEEQWVPPGAEERTEVSQSYPWPPW